MQRLERVFTRTLSTINNTNIKTCLLQLQPPKSANDLATGAGDLFCFDIQILWNIAASGVHAPLRGARPPTGNPVLDPPLQVAVE